jgi:pseudouridine kinase
MNLATVNPEVVVIGGLLLDLIYVAQPGIKVGSMLYTSTQGQLQSRSVGGVACNIARNLQQLKVPSLLISAVGEDADGDFLLDGLKEMGLATHGIIRFAAASTAQFVALLDAKGELCAAIDTTRIFDDHFNNPSIILQRFATDLKAAKVVVIDGNVAVSTVTEVFHYVSVHNPTAKCVFEPVSRKKCVKCLMSLPLIYAIKPNQFELIELEHALGDRNDVDRKGKLLAIDENVDLGRIQAGAELLLRSGVKFILTTMGPRGVLVSTREGHGDAAAHRHFPAKPVKVTGNTVGAGDSFLSGYIFGLIQNLPTGKCVECGLRASSLVIQCKEAVSPQLRPSVLLDGIHDM